MDPVTVAAPEPGTMTIGRGDVHAWLVDLDGWPAGRMVLAALALVSLLWAIALAGYLATLAEAGR